MSNKILKSDLLIIGAGPVGIFTAFQAGLLGMNSIVVDALDEIGGQLTALYPLKPIKDIPGFPSILAKDLIVNLIEQAKVYNPIYLLKQKVTSLTKLEKGYKIETSEGNVLEVKAVIIAGGAGAFGPTKLPIIGLEEYENKSVFYNIKDPMKFKGKTVVIAGGGDSAIDWALALSDNIASKVYLIHRREHFRAMPSSLEQLKNLSSTDKLDLVIPAKPKNIKGDNNLLTHVVVEYMNGEECCIAADYLLPFFGLNRDLAGLAEWGLEIDKIHGTITVTPSTYETNKPGIYVVGDMAKYEHKLKLIMVGFSEAAYAVHHSWKYVFPDKQFRFVHSTSK